MRYFKKDGQVFAFDDTQEDLITEDFIEMTDDEIDRHLYPKNYLTEQEKRDEFLGTLKPLTRRQFKLALLEHNLLETIEQAIDEVPDKTLKMRIQIEYSESERFERSNESVQYMLNILNLTETQVDEMWLYALTV
ncbi:hypothetical protein ACG94X_07200 [Acinetobacter sp. ULE_I010]|uniref:hypothetical protein n=1 Tax=Acinetobacter sp. ULE_I010 TaxID=3373065 RepID=UPI003AF47C80